MKIKITVKDILEIVNGLGPKYQTMIKFIQNDLEKAAKEGKLEEKWNEFRAGWNSGKNDPSKCIMPDMPTLDELLKMHKTH
jgi:hypothetical protein